MGELCNGTILWTSGLQLCIIFLCLIFILVSTDSDQKGRLEEDFCCSDLILWWKYDTDSICPDTPSLYWFTLSLLAAFTSNKDSMNIIKTFTNTFCLRYSFFLFILTNILKFNTGYFGNLHLWVGLVFLSWFHGIIALKLFQLLFLQIYF